MRAKSLALSCWNWPIGRGSIPPLSACLPRDSQAAPEISGLGLVQCTRALFCSADFQRGMSRCSCEIKCGFNFGTMSVPSRSHARACAWHFSGQVHTALALWFWHFSRGFAPPDSRACQLRFICACSRIPLASESRSVPLSASRVACSIMLHAHENQLLGIVPRH